MQDLQVAFPVGSIIRRQYIVVELLSRGPFGAVHLVRDKRNHYNRFVLKEVVSTVRKERHGYPFDTAALKRLNHPALPRIYQVFHSDRHDRAYVLMDYIEGRSLEAVQRQLPEKRASLPEALTLVAPIVDAVSYLHRQQPSLIHGDIKPSNIIVPKDGASSVLVDFGGFKGASQSASTAPQKSANNYLAPEQYSREAGVRSDIYALAAVLYTLLTGTPPAAASLRLARLAEKKPDPLLSVNQVRPSIPTTVAEAIHCAMTIERHDRFSTVDQFWEALWQVIYANPLWPKVPELTIAAPTEENTTEEDTGQDDDPTLPRLPRAVTTLPFEQNIELDANPLLPQITWPAVAEPEMEITTLFANPTTQPELASVEASSEPPPEPALPGEGTVPVLAQPHPVDGHEKPAPALPGEGTEPVREPLQGRPPLPRSKKSRLLFLLLLALIVIVGLGAGLWLYLAGHHRSAIVPPAAGQFQPTPHSTTNPPSRVTATPVSASGPYRYIARPYHGTIHDIPNNITTKMSLTGIQQQQGNFRGNFSGLLSNSTFTGTITRAGHIHFIVASNAGQAAISFDGDMQSDGGLAGTYCIPNQAGQCSNYGIWSASPDNVAQAEYQRTSLHSSQSTTS